MYDPVVQRMRKLAGIKPLNESDNEDIRKLNEINRKAKKLADYLFKTSNFNTKQVLREIKKLANAALKLERVISDDYHSTGRKKAEKLSILNKLSKGDLDFSENKYQNPYIYAANLLVSVTKY